jgi:Ribonucleotide reductase, barrel domain/Class II vitamin B12-dependent ribonucleotide reductase
MSNSMKKHGISLPFSRLFTREDRDAYELIYFKASQDTDEDTNLSLICPHNWSDEAASVLAEHAAYQSVPNEIRAVEENTVPSWLWRHRGNAKTVGFETSAGDIFDRAVGAATYTGWKQDVFADETSARAFFDEARYALAQRFIALEPRLLSRLGLDWAYGATKHAASPTAEHHTPQVTISNAVIDAVVGGKQEKQIRTKWHKATVAKSDQTPLTLAFTDIAADWGSSDTPDTQAMVDVMAFRHNDGSVNFEMLRHATRLLVILLDLNGVHENIAIGTCNFAPLLMALALPFDSDAARATAAAISAIITAEAYATSAELASLRGIDPVFAAHHEVTMRALRNRRRAAYGDPNDYEKISVLPAPLSLDTCTDLTLAAAARSNWDRAIDLVQQFGLRHIQVTSLTHSPEMMIFMESITQAIEPMRALTVTKQTDSDLFTREIHPSVSEGLHRLGVNQPTAINEYIVGTLSLNKASSINHKSLRARKFDAQAIKRVEDYLPYVNDIRLAFTPWILGEDFCRKTLKISATKLQNPKFSLLTQLRFSASDIAAANAWCYGHGTVKGALGLSAQQITVFACADDISPEAHIRMAAAVQPFVSGDVGLNVSLPANIQTERVEKLLLNVWRQGVKTVTIDYSAAPIATKEKAAKAARSAFFQNAKAASLPARRMAAKAAASLVSASTHKTKSKTARRWGR